MNIEQRCEEIKKKCKEIDKECEEIDKKCEVNKYVGTIVNRGIECIEETIKTLYGKEVLTQFKKTRNYKDILEQFKRVQDKCRRHLHNRYYQIAYYKQQYKTITTSLDVFFVQNESMFSNMKHKINAINYVNSLNTKMKKQIENSISFYGVNKQMEEYKNIIEDFDSLKNECYENIIKNKNYHTKIYKEKYDKTFSNAIKSLNKYKNSNINEEDSKSEYESCYSKPPKPDKTEEYEKSNHSINKIGIFGKENNNKEEEDIKYEDENCIEEIKNNMKYYNFMKNRQLKKEEDNKSNHNKINEIDKRLESSNSEIQPLRDSREYTDVFKLLKEYEKSNNSESIIIDNNSDIIEENNNGEEEENIKDEDDSFSKNIKLITIKQNIIRQDNNLKEEEEDKKSHSESIIIDNNSDIFEESNNKEEENKKLKEEAIINNALDEIYNQRNISFTDKVKNFCFEKWNSFKGLFKISCKDCNICLKNENQSQIINNFDN